MNDFTHHIPERIVNLIREGRHNPIFLTRFINTPESPYRRLLDWHACSEPPETDLVPEMKSFAKKKCVFDKKGFIGAPNGLIDHLNGMKITEISVAGIDTEMCVLKVAMDLFDSGIKPVVIVDCCASTEGLHAHLSGLAILSKNIGPQQLHMSCLTQGEMAAPAA